MKDSKTIALLIQELENDFSYLRGSDELLGKAALRVEASFWSDELDLMAFGGCLHGIYNALELRRFRHLFRNLYKTRLKAQKLRIVHEAAMGIADDFFPMHRAFIAWLRTLAEAV